MNFNCIVTKRRPGLLIGSPDFMLGSPRLCCGKVECEALAKAKAENAVVQAETLRKNSDLRTKLRAIAAPDRRRQSLLAPACDRRWPKHREHHW